MKKTIFFLTLLMVLPFTLAKAQTSGENIDVTHYEIHVNELDFTNHTLQGETFVTFTATVVLAAKRLLPSLTTAW